MKRTQTHPYSSNLASRYLAAKQRMAMYLISKSHFPQTIAALGNTLKQPKTHPQAQPLHHTLSMPLYYNLCVISQEVRLGNCSQGQVVGHIPAQSLVASVEEFPLINGMATAITGGGCNLRKYKKSTKNKWLILHSFIHSFKNIY